MNGNNDSKKNDDKCDVDIYSFSLRFYKQFFKEDLDEMITSLPKTTINKFITNLVETKVKEHKEEKNLENISLYINNIIALSCIYYVVYLCYISICMLVVGFFQIFYRIEFPLLFHILSFVIIPFLTMWIISHFYIKKQVLNIAMVSKNRLAKMSFSPSYLFKEINTKYGTLYKKRVLRSVRPINKGRAYISITDDSEFVDFSGTSLVVILRKKERSEGDEEIGSHIYRIQRRPMKWSDFK